MPAAAEAHSEIRIAAGELAYLSEDAPSASRLEITPMLASIRLYDPGTVGGMQAPSQCSAGRTNDRGEIVEFTCPSTGIARLFVDVGPNEDHASVLGPIAVRLVGGHGADRLHGSDGADTVEPGDGADEIDAAAGDDSIGSADGVRDVITCGPGDDHVAADTLDAVATDCERVQRREVSAPAGSTAGDTQPPVLRVRAPRSARRVSVTATTSDSGRITASGYLSVGGRNDRLKTVDRAAGAARRIRLTLPLTKSQARRVRRARRATAVVDVVATDAAGNSSARKRVRIRLRAR